MCVHLLVIPLDSQLIPKQGLCKPSSELLWNECFSFMESMIWEVSF